MPDYVSVGVRDAQDMPSGEWVTVSWDLEYSDDAHHHRTEGGPSVVEGPARYTPNAEFLARDGETFVDYALAADTVGSGQRVRFQVIHYGTGTARLVSGTAKALAWRL